MGLFEKAMEAFTPKPTIEESMANMQHNLKLLEEAKRMATMHAGSFKRDLENLCNHIFHDPTGTLAYHVNFALDRGCYEVTAHHRLSGLRATASVREDRPMMDTSIVLRNLRKKLEAEASAVMSTSMSMGPGVPTAGPWGAVVAAPAMALTNEEITRIRRMLAAFEEAVKEKESDGSSQ